MNEPRFCEQCGFFKLDIILDHIGHCTISGNMHFPEDICEAEKEVAADG
jgi:hypothetical protein